MKIFNKLLNRTCDNYSIILKLIDADYAPVDLVPQLPITITLLKQIASSDRPDYWIAKTNNPITWNKKEINYLIVATRFVGVTIKKGIKRVVLNVAYVIDESVIKDSYLDFTKCQYVAICIANEL